VAEVNKPDQANGSEAFMAILEAGVTKVLENRKSTAAERMAAVNAGVKLLAIRNKIEGSEDSDFFK